MRYQSLIPNPATVAPIGRVVHPGEEFDSEVGLFHPELVPLDDEAKAHVAAIEAENAKHAAEYAARTSGQGVESQLPEVPMSSYRAALGLPPLPPTPEPSDEEKRIRGLAPLQDTAAEDAPPTTSTPAPPTKKAAKE